MTDAFDRLEAQLRQATRDQGAPAGRPATTPTKRRRGWRRAGLAVAVVALVGGGSAAAIAELAASPAQVQDGRHYSFLAVRKAARLPACRVAHEDTSGLLRFTDAAPLPAIVRAIPGIARTSPAEQAAALQAKGARATSGGPVLRSTLHVLRFADGVTGVVYVQQGSGFTTLRDPAACAEARRTTARKLTAREPAVVQRETMSRLAAMRDTRPHQQTLWVETRVPGGEVTGAGTPLAPGDPFAGGLLAVSGPAPKMGDQRSSYIGLADPRTRRIAVAAQHRRAEVPRTVERSGAFWSLLLPPGTGRVRVVERAADGSTIRTVRVR